MASRTTARIHLLPAKQAPVVAIIRRKPSKVFHVMRWNTETDEIEHGSWFRGKLYPLRSDVSFDGNWMVYLAMGASGNTWNGLCRLPWLKTVCVGTWNGGGYWANKTTLLTNAWCKIKREEKPPFKLSPLSTEYGEDEGVLYPRMERDGWKRAGPFGKRREVKNTKKYTVVCEDDSGWRFQPTTKHPCLWCFYRGYLDHGRTFEFSLEGHPEILGQSVDWATWDSVGQLIVARSGAVEKYRLSDMPLGKPSFELSFEDLGPPTGPVATSRENDWPTFDSPLLRRIVEAFGKRRKAIRHKTSELTCERELDEQDGKPYERLNIQVGRLEKRPTRVRLSIWEDYGLWLGVHQPAKRGWAFKIEFHGHVESIGPDEVVRIFEETMSLASEVSRSDKSEDEIKELWKEAKPR